MWASSPAGSSSVTAIGFGWMRYNTISPSLIPGTPKMAFISTGQSSGTVRKSKTPLSFLNYASDGELAGQLGDMPADLHRDSQLHMLRGEPQQKLCRQLSQHLGDIEHQVAGLVLFLKASPAL